MPKIESAEEFAERLYDAQINTFPALIEADRAVIRAEAKREVLLECRALFDMYFVRTNNPLASYARALLNLEAKYGVEP